MYAGSRRGVGAKSSGDVDGSATDGRGRAGDESDSELGAGQAEQINAARGRESPRKQSRLVLGKHPHDRNVYY